MILEADKSRDLQLACWRRRSADDVVPVQVRRPETGVSSRLKASRLASQREPIFQTESQGKKKPMSQPEGSRQEFPSTYGGLSLFVLFRPSADWMKPIHFTEGSLHYSIY